MGVIHPSGQRAEPRRLLNPWRLIGAYPGVAYTSRHIRGVFYAWLLRLYAAFEYPQARPVWIGLMTPPRFHGRY